MKKSRRTLRGQKRLVALNIEVGIDLPNQSTELVFEIGQYILFTSQVQLNRASVTERKLGRTLLLFVKLREQRWWNLEDRLLLLLLHVKGCNFDLVRLNSRFFKNLAILCVDFDRIGKVFTLLTLNLPCCYLACSSQLAQTLHLVLFELTFEHLPLTFISCCGNVRLVSVTSEIGIELQVLLGQVRNWSFWCSCGSFIVFILWQLHGLRN